MAFMEKPVREKDELTVASREVDHVDCSDSTGIENPPYFLNRLNHTFSTGSCQEGWADSFLPSHAAFRQLVFVEGTISLQCNCLDNPLMSFPTVRKLTYVRGRFEGKGEWSNVTRLDPSFLESITFTDCSCDFYRTQIPVHSQLEYWENTLETLQTSPATVTGSCGVVQFSIT
ncbi:hypothetical protein RvY_03000 [Ramazzottius varieornatus]|uniref:Uncharacterized protein n=1 Tax=Ramazzottius varieornatus TaxID=947166 RepID=A0A1D1UQD2_RAMVA|nr:hypothetical protein RvY_03000 [Ramazzottius varieornatus]